MSTPFEVWTRPPSEAPGREGDPTYYDRPVLKEPVWIWAVPAYFYAGGVSGAAAVLGAVAQVAGPAGSRPLVERARWVAAAGGAVGTALLVHDLGRPERFLNMLRVFRPTSPLNVGSWILAAAVPLSAVAALLGRAEGTGRRLGDAAGLAAGAFGLPLATYTAVLLSNTAVPVWREGRRSLPALFAASAASGAAAVLEPLPLPPDAARAVHRFGLLGTAAELAAMRWVERDTGTIERVGRPLHEGTSGALWRAARALTVAGLAVSLWPGRSRAKTLVSSLLVTGGGIAMRFALLHAGRASARDPRATFHLQRGAGDGPGEGERTVR